MPHQHGESGESGESGDSVQLDGHGNGHGIGLSQWGAYGYAVNFGWTVTQILDHYYGGTVSAASDIAGVPGTSNITVRLMAEDDQQTAVVHDSSQLKVDGIDAGPWPSVVARETAPGSYTVWARSDAAVCPAPTDPLTSGWMVVGTSLPTVTIRTLVDVSSSTNVADLLAVCEPSGKVRSYRGVIRAANGTAGENRTVNDVPVEQYLRPIVATEMSASWGPAGGGRGAQALQAQAVAARSYGIAENKYSYAKTCDLVCQSYPGAAWRSAIGAAYNRVEQPATDAAVLATSGIVRRVGSATGPVAYAMFSASSGGYTAASTLGFPAVIDEGDATAGNPAHQWTAVVSTATIAKAWPTIGVYTGLTVTQRTGQGDWGGRVVTMVVTGTSGSVTITGDQFRRALGLKSNWFQRRGEATPPTGPAAGLPAPGLPAPGLPAAGAPSPGPCPDRQPPPVTGPPATAPAARFQPIAPVRLVDSREGFGTARAPVGSNCTIVVQPPVDDAATAVAVNITTVNSVADGFLTAYPCGVDRPLTATVQPLAGQIVGGTALVPLGPDGTFCVFSNVPTDVVVDLFGVYSTSAAAGFEPIVAQRGFDSRGGSRLSTGTVVRVNLAAVALGGAVGAGAGAGAVALTVHALDAATAGFVTAWPCDSPMPLVSAANVAAGGSVTNHVEVAVGPSGEVCFYVSAPMHLTVDVVGWFGPTATTTFHALTPFRLADTREGVGWAGPATRGLTRSVGVAGIGGLPGPGVVRAVAAQFTAVDAVGAGWVTVDSCQIPVLPLSMLRYPAARNAAVLVTGIATNDGRWCVTTNSTTQLVVDVTGWFG